MLIDHDQELLTRDWYEKIQLLPEHQQVEAIASQVVRGHGGATLLLDFIIQHHGIFRQILFNSDFANKIQEVIQEKLQVSTRS